MHQFRLLLTVVLILALPGLGVALQLRVSSEALVGRWALVRYVEGREDVTESRAAQERLRISEERLRLALAAEEGAEGLFRLRRFHSGRRIAQRVLPCRWHMMLLVLPLAGAQEQAV